MAVVSSDASPLTCLAAIQHFKSASSSLRWSTDYPMPYGRKSPVLPALACGCMASGRRRARVGCKSPLVDSRSRRERAPFASQPGVHYARGARTVASVGGARQTNRPRRSTRAIRPVAPGESESRADKNRNESRPGVDEHAPGGKDGDLHPVAQAHGTRLGNSAPEPARVRHRLETMVPRDPALAGKPEFSGKTLAERVGLTRAIRALALRARFARPIRLSCRIVEPACLMFVGSNPVITRAIEPIEDRITIGCRIVAERVGFEPTYTR